MFKMIGTISNCISDTVSDLSDVIKPLTNSAKLGAQAIELHAQELHDDTAFQCEKKRKEREAAMLEFEKELMDLSEEN